MECPVACVYCVLCSVFCDLCFVSCVEYKSGAWSGSEGESWEGAIIEKKGVIVISRN